MPLVLAATDQAIAEAVARLRSGQLVAFPTETVYGLGADTFNHLALQMVFALKGRPTDNPLIAHVAESAEAAAISRGWDARCDALAARFWPGPLTLVLEKADSVPELATAGRPTVALRCPRHPVARNLLQALGGPISAPSANRSGHVSPTTAQHVADDFADAADLLILDGGRCEVGIESTVLDMTADPPAILRPGSVTAEELSEQIGAVQRPAPSRRQGASPGTAPAHYAPSGLALMVEHEHLALLLHKTVAPAMVLCFDPEDVPPPHRPVEMPQGGGDYARMLYRALRDAESEGAGTIIIEAPPGSWRAVHDRLSRATTRWEPEPEEEEV